MTELDLARGTGALVEDEASHLTRVLRLTPGAAIDVFDGQGGMFEARVTQVARDRVALDIVAPVEPAPEPGVRVGLAACVLKGDRMDAVVRDAAMMGAASLQPLVSVRTEVTVAALLRGHRVERWRRIAVSSVKQCGRAVVPDIHAPVTLEQWLASSAGERRLGLMEPSVGRGHGLAAIAPSPAVALIVGPEGGWSAGEIAAMTGAGVEPVSLGRRTIRAEAAPIVALAALYEAWKGW